MQKQYSILLDKVKIGISVLEKADAPMGVIFGKIEFTSNKYTYTFFKEYLKGKSLEPVTDIQEDKLIAFTIPGLQVISPNGVEIKGEATVLEGMDSDGYEITILGVPYPFFAEEFPHHLLDE